jgi:succinate dehydrogenase / fumarate reductase, membrane anchor subunit
MDNGTSKGTPIGRVRGLGSARSGGHHWLQERASSLAAFGLCLFLIFAVLGLGDLSYAKVQQWISGPVPATAVALLVIVLFWHSKMGLQVLIEDYVHGANKVVCLLLNTIFSWGGAAFALLCIIRLALGAK